jgi:hypothetical protein
MASFWLPLRQGYFIITQKATEAFIPFSISYLCEAGFSDMNTMKSKKKVAASSTGGLEGQSSDLVQGKSRDITKHMFPTDIFMLT